MNIGITSCNTGSNDSRDKNPISEEDSTSKKSLEYRMLSEPVNNKENVDSNFQVELKGTMISSGQISPYQDIQYMGCKFQLVKNEHGDTIYLSTTDSKFKSPEGYAVGNSWETINKRDKLKIERMPGWGYYIKLDSDWQLGFCEGQSCTDQTPSDGSKIKWIFKRN